METGDVPPRTIQNLDPALTTYFWLYKENHDVCHLYMNLKTEEALSKDFFGKDHRGRNLLVNAGTQYKSRVTAAQANEKLRELLNTGDDYWLCTDDH